MTEEELYNKLVKMEYSAQDINQLLKAKEEGYEICNVDIKMTTNQIREFRQFLKENIEVGMDHMQLREILLGWMKNLDLSIYCNKKYSGAEMSVLRKAIENNKDIELLKKYGKDKESMLEVSRAMGYGCTEKDFEKYNTAQLRLFNNYQKRKIDIRRFLDKGFNEDQISYLIAIEKKHKDALSYFTKDYHFTTIMSLGVLLDNYSYEQIKPLFSPDSSIPLIGRYKRLLDNGIAGWEKYVQPKHHEKSFLLANLLEANEDKELLNNILNSACHPYVYSQIDILYFKRCCSSEQLVFLCKAAHENLHMDNLLTERLDSKFYPIIYELEKFNSQNERKLNIEELIHTFEDFEKFKEIAKNLMSPSLDDNLTAYSQMSSPKDNEKEINFEKNF